MNYIFTDEKGFLIEIKSFSGDERGDLALGYRKELLIKYGKVLVWSSMGGDSGFTNQ